MTLKTVIYALLLTPMLSQTALHARQNDSEKPVHISADRMTLDEANGVTQYFGNVRLTQGSILITADHIKLVNRDGGIHSMLLNGGQDVATFQQYTDSGQIIQGQAKQIRYKAKQGLLTLQDTAQLLQGNNLIRSERIDYNTKTNNLTAGNGEPASNPVTAKSDAEDTQRVRIVITPDKSTDDK